MGKVSIWKIISVIAIILILVVFVFLGTKFYIENNKINNNNSNNEIID